MPPAAPAISLDDPSLYLNRELSWLEFNRRVLGEARDPSVPLFERVKFLAIFGSNLDEFFMVRVGGLQQKVVSGITRGSLGDKMRPAENLDRIREAVADLVGLEYRCWLDELKPALAELGVVIRRERDLTPAHRKFVLEMFRSQIFPVLTPLAVDPGHPFPHLANKSLNVAVVLRRPGESDLLFAVVQVPPLRPRLVELPRDPDLPKDAVELVTLETVIRMHLADLFHGMEIADSVCFRVTRDSEFELEEEEVDDLLRAIEENVKQRRRGHPVRLEVEATAPAAVEKFLTEALDVLPEDVTRVPGELDLTMLFQVHGLPGFPQHRDPPALPTFVKEFPTPQAMWAAIRSGTSWSTTPTSRSSMSSISSTPPPTMTTSTPSSRHSTAPARTARSSKPCSAPPTVASRSRPSLS